MNYNTGVMPETVDSLIHKSKLVVSKNCWMLSSCKYKKTYCHH